VSTMPTSRTPIDPALFQRRIFRGNPPHAPHVWGWRLKLGRPATQAERAWLREHGYAFSGGRWHREDREAP
jgi:hypothetical protein